MRLPLRLVPIRLEEALTEPPARATRSPAFAAGLGSFVFWATIVVDTVDMLSETCAPATAPWRPAKFRRSSQ
jgi:hypothetical protein